MISIFLHFDYTSTEKNRMQEMKTKESVDEKNGDTKGHEENSIGRRVHP